MGNLKSHCLLWTALATHHRYRSLVEKEDLYTFSIRAENEGLAFLTSTLPMLGKALDTFHSTTQWKPPSGFKLDDDDIPLFLGKCIRFALDGNSLAVDCIRQLSYIFYKLEVDYDKGTVAEFIDRFITTDHNLANALDLSNIFVADHVAAMKRVIQRILCNADPLDIRPCHGSGATACRTVNEDKWHKLRYYPKLDNIFPYPDYFFYNYDHLIDDYSKLESSAESIPCARVVLVPKDARGPRIISCEPAELMYIQQGLMRLMYRTIENHPLTRGQINFTDQKVNQAMARQGSIDDSIATIDLSDASDRVSLSLVRSVFPPNWVECLEACRSEFTILPSGDLVKLNKFAPMGSACCFPVEALVFWASCWATLRRLKISEREIPVYVYGDDIIIRADVAPLIMDDLETIGLLVNRDKSFLKGPFRESCGGDYHSGYDVTPVRVRKDFDKSHSSIVTTADLANNLVAKFGYEDTLPILNLLEESVGYRYPRTELSIPCSIRFSSCSSNDVHYRKRSNKSLQRTEYRILQPSTRALALREPSWCELLRKELSGEFRDDTAGNSFEVKPSKSLQPGEYVVTRSTRLKWVWTWLGEPGGAPLVDRK
jgi:hypothetical protein